MLHPHLDGILKDETHPANHLFTLLPSGRRYRATTARTSRLQNTCILRAITELNNHTTLIPSTQHNCTFFLWLHKQISLCIQCTMTNKVYSSSILFTQSKILKGKEEEPSKPADKHILSQDKQV